MTHGDDLAPRQVWNASATRVRHIGCGFTDLLHGMRYRPKQHGIGFEVFSFTTIDIVANVTRRFEHVFHTHTIIDC